MSKLTDKLLQEQKKYPTVVVDNFFKNPDIIREFGLSLEYEVAEDGRWPGERSVFLHEVNQLLYHFMIRKILSVYFDLHNVEVKWDDIQMMFQKVKKFDDLKDTVKNKGWMHIDEEQTFAGIIFLTPNIDKDCGTSIYRLKDEHKDFVMSDYMPTAKKAFYSKNNIDLDEYEKEYNKLHEKFEPITIVKNIYNRLIMFDSKEYHAANQYFTDGDERLTFVFFFKNVQCNKKPLDVLHESDTDIENEIIKIKNGQ